MKRLLIFRHAKSDWGAGDDSDHERGLTSRGVTAAKTMGRFLGLAGQAPERILCSSATRTRLTLEHAMEAGEWQGSVEIEPSLYLAEAQTVFDLLHASTDAVKSLMLVGHEPTSSEMVRLLCGCALPGAGEMVRFPTATLARVDLAIDSWRDCEPGCGQLRWMLPPKLLTKGDFDFIA